MGGIKISLNGLEGTDFFHKIQPNWDHQIWARWFFHIFEATVFLQDKWEGFLTSSSLLFWGPFFHECPILKRYPTRWTLSRAMKHSKKFPSLCVWRVPYVIQYSNTSASKEERPTLCLLFSSGREVASMILCFIIRSGSVFTSMILDLLFRNQEWTTLCVVDIPKICGSRLAPLPRTHIFEMPPTLGLYPILSIHGSWVGSRERPVSQKVPLVFH
jgi:hypothetical protein